MRPVSNTELSSYQRCKRRWYLAYHLELSPLPETESATGSRNLGIRVHQALQADQEHPGKGPLHWLSEVYIAAMEERPEASLELEKERQLAWVMVEGFTEWAAETGLNEGIEVVAAEQDVTVPMPGMYDVYLRGKIDQVIRRQSDGVLLFRDWKTTGSLNQAHAALLSPQPRFYAMLQRLSTEDNDARVDGGQFVYLLRSKRTVRATPPFYEVVEVRYNRHDMNAAYMRARSVIISMMNDKRRLAEGEDHHLVVPPTPMSSCSWDCAFYTMCPLMDDGSRWVDMAAGEFIKQDPYAYYDRPLPDE